MPEHARCDEVDHRSAPAQPRLCRECLFHDKIRDVFSQDALRKQPSLAGARDSLLAADTTHWSRFFAVATGALPVRDERVVALEAWIGSAAERIGSEEDRRAFVRFARWRHLRQARQKPLAESKLAWRRRELILVSRFLQSLHSSGSTLQTATQAHLEAWLVEGTKDRKRIRPFLKWCRANAISGIVNIPVLPTSSLPKTAGLADGRRQELLREVLDPAVELDQGLRLAAGLLLVFGCRPHELTGLRLRDFVVGKDAVHICLGPEPLQLPKALEIHARAAIAARSVARFGGIVKDNEWLFPGQLHGRSVTTSTVTRRLRAIGLEPAPARSAAMGQLAMQLPPVILARLTGITVPRAVGWHAVTSASQARNLPDLPRIQRGGVSIAP